MKVTNFPRVWSESTSRTNEYLRVLTSTALSSPTDESDRNAHYLCIRNSSNFSEQYYDYP